MNREYDLLLKKINELRERSKKHEIELMEKDE